MHFLTLSWDDEFHKSSLKTAEIFKMFGLRAEFNIVATANLPNIALPENMQPDTCWGAPYGDLGYGMNSRRVATLFSPMVIDMPTSHNFLPRRF